MRHSPRNVLTAAQSQSSSSFPTRCTSIYLCGGTSSSLRLLVAIVGQEMLGLGQGVRVVHQRALMTPTPPHPPRPPPQPRSSPPPTAWSGRQLAARLTRCCTAAARCWLQSCLVMTLGRLSKTQSLGKMASPSVKRKRRRRRRVCFSVRPASAAVPLRQVVAPAKTSLHQTTPPPNLSISSPCQPSWNATPPNAFYSLRRRCQSPAPWRLSSWPSIITQSHPDTARQLPQTARVTGHKCKPKASHQSRATTTQEHACAERNTPPTTVSDTQGSEGGKHAHSLKIFTH